MFLQYYCQNPETLLISSRFYWVSDIFGKIGNSIVFAIGFIQSEAKCYTAVKMMI